MFCAYCGKQIVDDARFCSYCGKPVPGATPHVVPKQNSGVISLSCPSCNASMQLSADQTEASCPYCGHHFLITAAMTQKVDVHTHIEDAESAGYRLRKGAMQADSQDREQVLGKYSTNETFGKHTRVTQSNKRLVIEDAKGTYSFWYRQISGLEAKQNTLRIITAEGTFRLEHLPDAQKIVDSFYRMMA